MIPILHKLTFMELTISSSERCVLNKACFPLKTPGHLLAQLKVFHNFLDNFSALIKKNHSYNAGFTRFGLLVGTGAAARFLKFTLNNHKINFCLVASIKNFSLDFLKFLVFAFPRLGNQAQRHFTNFHLQYL